LTVNRKPLMTTWSPAIGIFSRFSIISPAMVS
jgi:hypothetical protein